MKTDINIDPVKFWEEKIPELVGESKITIDFLNRFCHQIQKELYPILDDTLYGQACNKINDVKSRYINAVAAQKASDIYSSENMD